MCKRLLFAGDACDTDFQCGFDMICTSTTGTNVIADIKQCMLKSSLVEGALTGYKAFESDTYKDAIANGMKCKSGLCRRTSATECRCFSIANVTSDYGV